MREATYPNLQPQGAISYCGFFMKEHEGLLGTSVNEVKYQYMSEDVVISVCSALCAFVFPHLPVHA